MSEDKPRIGIAVGTGGPQQKGPVNYEKIMQLAEVADDVGVDTLWIPETWGRDCVTLLTQLVLRTKKIKIGTSIMPIYSRSPGIIAQTFATLDELSEGRMIIGLGTSGNIVIEQWHGVEFKDPIGMLREYVEIIQMMIGGERVNYDGKHFQLQRFKRNMTPVRKRIPIYLATLAPKSVRQTGELADGWMPTSWPLSKLHVGIEHLKEGADKAGRSVDEIDVVYGGGLAVTDGSSEANNKVEMMSRGGTAFYIGRMGKFYYNNLVRHGWKDACDAVRAKWDKRDPMGASMAIPKELIDELYFAGDIDQCRERIKTLHDNGTTLINMGMPGSDPKKVRETLEALLA